MSQINLKIEQGEYVSIMGPSGSGKTTLLNIIGCLDIPSSGKYFLEDLDVSNFSENELAQIRSQKIGFVFQSYNLLPRATVLRNVEIPMIYSGRKEREKIAKNLIEFVGLSHRINHKPNQLSGGEQQRVAIARALTNNSSIILADEPTGNVDSLTGEKIMALLASLNKQGQTLIVVTHDEYIARKSRRIIKLRDGRIVREDWILTLG